MEVFWLEYTELPSTAKPQAQAKAVTVAYPLETGSSLLTEVMMTLAAGCTVTAGYKGSWSGLVQKHLLNH